MKIQKFISKSKTYMNSAVQMKIQKYISKSKTYIKNKKHGTSK